MRVCDWLSWALHLTSDALRRRRAALDVCHDLLQLPSPPNGFYYGQLHALADANLCMYFKQSSAHQGQSTMQPSIPPPHTREFEGRVQIVIPLRALGIVLFLVVLLGVGFVRLGRV